MHNLGHVFFKHRERKINPLISRRYPLAQALQALEALLNRQAVGKVVILPQQVG